MPKYVGNQEYLTPKRSFTDKLAIASEGVAKGIQTYGQMKQMQEAKAVLADPKSTPIQQAMALASMGHEKIGSDVYKGAQKESQIKNLMDMYQQAGLGGGANVAGTTAPIHANEPMTSAQPESEGTGSPTQPGFSPSAPSRAASNATALNQPATGAPPMRQPAPMMQNAPQETPQPQQLTPRQEAQRLRALGGQMNAVQQGSGNAILDEAKAIEKEAQAEKIADAKVNAIERKERLKIHESYAKADAEIDKGAKQSRGQIHAFDRMRKDIETGKLDPKNFTNLLRKSLENTRWKEFFLNPEQAEFQAAALESYEGMKDMFGVRLSDSDLELASGKVPSLDKSEQANLAVLDFLEFKARMKEAEAQIADEIKDENGGYRPIDYTSQIRKRMQEKYGQEAENITRRAAYDGEIGPKFDIANPEHKARRDKILQSVNGDFQKAEQLLMQEFIP